MLCCGDVDLNLNILDENVWMVMGDRQVVSSLVIRVKIKRFISLFFI